MFTETGFLLLHDAIQPYNFVFCNALRSIALVNVKFLRYSSKYMGVPYRGNIAVLR